MNPLFTIVLVAITGMYLYYGFTDTSGAGVLLVRLGYEMVALLVLYFLTHSGLDYIRSFFNQKNPNQEQLNYDRHQLQTYAIHRLFDVYVHTLAYKEERFEGWLRRHILIPDSVGLDKIGKYEDHPFVPSGWKGTLEQALYVNQAWFEVQNQDKKDRFFILRFDKRQHEGSVNVLFIAVSLGNEPALFHARQSIPLGASEHIKRFDGTEFKSFNLAFQESQDILRAYT